MGAINKIFSGVAIIALALWLGINHLDHGTLIELLSRISIGYMLLASMMIVGVMALSTSRFSYIDQKFGGDESWLFLHRVNMLSLLYSQIGLPLIAQIIGRVSHGTKERRIYYAPLTILEKSIAFTIMIIFGGAASYALLNQNIILKAFRSTYRDGMCNLFCSRRLALFFFTMKNAAICEQC